MSTGLRCSNPACPKLGARWIDWHGERSPACLRCAMRWRRNGDFTLKSGKAKGAADLMDMQLLRAADGLSYDKIGALYKISGNTARRRLEEAAKRARAAH